MLGPWPHVELWNADTLRTETIPLRFGAGPAVLPGDGPSDSGRQIPKGDLEALLEHFRSHDVSSEDLLELEQAVLSDSPASDGDFGPKVTPWIGKMVWKAASGAWKVGADQAAVMVTKAILRYYGISE